MKDWGEAYTDGLRYRVAACHLADNLEWREDATGYQCSSHAHFSFCTDATEVVFECTDYSHYSTCVTPVILKDGELMATLPLLPVNESERSIALAFPPGRKTCDRYQPSTVWLAVGVNDYQGPDPLTADVFTLTYARLLDLLRQRLPHADVVAQSPLVKVGEDERNAVGMTLNDYRQAIRLATTDRPGCQYIDGRTILTVDDLVDGVHPHTVGMAKYAAFAREVLH